MREPPSRGFSLIETLVAATIVIVALGGLAQLSVVSIAANQRARSRTVATVLAQEKLEELMASEAALGAAAGADFIDSRGHRIGSGDMPPPGTAYVRRWSAEPMPENPAASILQVWVTPTNEGGVDAARIVGLKNRGGAGGPWK